MKFFFLLICLVSIIAFGQKRRFFDVLDKSPFVFYPKSNGPSDRDIEIIHFDSIRASSSFLFSINNHRYRIAKRPFIQDSIYNRICHTVLNSLNNSIYINSKVWLKKRRYIYKALVKLRSNNRFYHAYAFKIKLVKYGLGQYYYDKNDDETELHLIYGNKNRSKKKIQRGEPLDYIEPITEQKFNDLVLKKIMRSIGKSNFKLSYYDTIGIAIKLNRRTINRRAIPEAKVVVMLGGKVMQKIRL